MDLFPNLSKHLKAAGQDMLTPPSSIDEDNPALSPTEQMAGQGAANVISAASDLLPEKTDYPLISQGEDAEKFPGAQDLRFDPTAIGGMVKSIKAPAHAAREAMLRSADTVGDLTTMLKNWQSAENPSARDALAETSLVPEALRQKALHKLMGQSEARINPETGEREYKLYRGTGDMEAQVLNDAGQTTQSSSFSPKYLAAKKFASGDNNTFQSWVPESKIAMIPKELGNPFSRLQGANPFQYENEVITKPGVVLEPAVQPQQTLNQAINERSQINDVSPSFEQATRQELLRNYHHKSPMPQEPRSGFMSQLQAWLDSNKQSK